MANRRSFPRARTVIVLLVLAVAAGFGSLELWWLYNAKRFQEIRPGMLYRTGQPTERGLGYMIEHKHIRTVVTLQSFSPLLKKDAIDFGKPSGRYEADFVRQLNVRYEHWPLGEEMCWPWPAPWHLEEYFKLLDEPSNRPVLIHCQGGRHRTGTLAAIFRLEYDRWPVERALEEMYSFNFGPPVPIQEHNLRTYVPRPRPNAEQWQALKAHFFPLLTDTAPENYEGLVCALRHHRDRAALRASVEQYLSENRPFALPLIYRLIDSTDDPLIAPAIARADQIIDEPGHTFDDVLISASLIADFGEQEQQEQLLGLLAGLQDGPVSQQYAALVAGVTNRFTPNRLAYLRPLLDDRRERLEPVAAYTRYCDTAVARMQTILDKPFFEARSHTGWDGARTEALNWFELHGDEARLTKLQTPTGRNVARAMRDNETERTQLQ